MKILILGTFVDGSLENYYYKGFIAGGHEVTRIECLLEYYDLLRRNIFCKVINNVNSDLLLKSFNFKLIKSVSSKKFDVIIVFKGMTLFPATIFKLKNNCRLMINYNPDHPIQFLSKGSGNSNVRNSLRLYDIVITYSENIRQTLRNDLGISAEVVPFGYNILRENTRPMVDRKTIKFIGTYDLDRFKKLDSVLDSGLQIFGDIKWSKFNGLEGKSGRFNNKKIYGDDFVREVQSSLLVVNILRQQNIIEKSHNMRTFEIPALGSVLLGDYTDEQASFFEPDKEMLYYKNTDELNEKIELLRCSPNIVKMISDNAFYRSESSNYSYYHRSLEMIRIIKLYI